MFYFCTFICLILTCTRLQMWEFKSDGHIYCSLRLYKSSILYGCHARNLYRLETSSDSYTLRYKVKLGSAVSSTPNIVELKTEPYVVVATTSGSILLVNFDTGQMVQNIDLPGEVFSSPAVDKNELFVGCRDNNLYCIAVREK